MNEIFHHIAVKVSNKVGSHWAFMAALLLIVTWATLGLIFGFSDTWLLIINTTCSVTTFLIVFIIQNSQNRQSKAMQIKLDELLTAVDSARTELVDLEDLTDKELDDIEEDFRRLRLEVSEKDKSKK